MKKIISVLLLVVMIFSFAGCGIIGAGIVVESGTVKVENASFPTKLVLVGDENKPIEDREFFQKLVSAIDGKKIDNSPVITDELCECELTYTVQMTGTYPKGYYLTLHDHGIEISAYCKFRKCMDLLGIVEVDEAAMTELIDILDDM